MEFYNDRGLALNVGTVHGRNPVLLVEKITREKIMDSVFWKLHCFGVDILDFVDKSVLVRVVSGSVDTLPSHFQCLVLKLMQIQPPRDIVLEFLHQKRFKYLTCLAMVYVRMCYESREVYETLEPFYRDYRKIRYRADGSGVRLSHIDEFVDDLLRSERVCDLMLPRLVQRRVLEQSGLEPMDWGLSDSDGGSNSDSDGGSNSDSDGGSNSSNSSDSSDGSDGSNGDSSGVDEDEM